MKFVLSLISMNRRWQVWYDGYRLGMSCHGAPVRIIHKMPFRIVRLSTLGLPLPSAPFTGFGKNGSTTVHCSTVISIGPLPTNLGLSLSPPFLR